MRSRIAQKVGSGEHTPVEVVLQVIRRTDDGGVVHGTTEI